MPGGGGTPYAMLGNLASMGVGQIDMADGDQSIVGDAAGGMLKGAGTGAAIGSIIPGVGTLIGAGIGAAIGGGAGGINGKKREDMERKMKERQMRMQQRAEKFKYSSQQQSDPYGLNNLYKL